MRCERHHATFQRAGRNGCDIVHETLLRDFRQLHAHVASAGDDVVALDRERCAQRPIAVRSHLHDLFAGRRFDGSHRVVCAAERDELAVGRPAHAVERVVSDRRRDDELALGDIPDLHLTQTRGIATSHREPLTVRREAQRLHAFRKSDQSRG